MLKTTLIVCVLAAAMGSSEASWEILSEPPAYQNRDPASPDISELHRDKDNNSVVMLLGKAGRGKSSFARALTGASHTSDDHVLRLPNPQFRAVAGARAEEGTELFKFGGSNASSVGHAEITRAMQDGAMTTHTSVVETSFLPQYRDGNEDAPLVLIDTPGINDAGVVVDNESGECKADEFLRDIIENTLHVNNSYGGIDRFILTVDATQHRNDANAVACIRQLAHSFGCEGSTAPGTAEEKEHAEMRFMSNLSIVFTHSDNILNEEIPEMQEAGIEKALRAYQDMLYKNSPVAKRLGTKLVHNVGLNRELELTEIACYFVDNDSVRVRQRTDAELDQEIDNMYPDRQIDAALRTATRHSLLNKVSKSNDSFQLTCENIKALRQQLKGCQKVKFEPEAVASVARQQIQRLRDAEAAATRAAQRAGAAEAEARRVGDRAEADRQRRIREDQEKIAREARESAEFWECVLCTTVVGSLWTGAAVVGGLVAGPVGVAVAVVAPIVILAEC